MGLSSISEAIEDIKAGKFIIVVDDELIQKKDLDCSPSLPA